MKATKLISILILVAGILSCSEEEKVSDPIYEFVSFIGNSPVNLNEYNNSEEAYPLVVQLWAFKPYAEDIDLTLEVTETSAEEGVDFSLSPSGVLKIRAGSLTSDTVWIQTVDNGDKNEDRSFEVKLKTVSKSDVHIGLGLSEPEKFSIAFNILDDECDATTEIYNSELTNTIGDATTTVTGVLNNNTLKLTGDLINYGAFSNASLTLTLTPSPSSATRGSATFGEQETGTDADGYEYKFIEKGDGSYDVCSGTVSIEYDIYYLDGANWIFWYSVTNVFSAP